MPWPVSQDYNEAIQNPRTSFKDPELKLGTPILSGLGLPMPRSGNFADVYEFIGSSGTKWAVKCFTRQVPGLRERYQELSNFLSVANLPFMVHFEYLNEGILFAGSGMRS
jgi:hypothetical protein